MSDRLQNKVCVVLGGTSGIGAAISERFVQEGAVVIPVSRRKSATKSMVNALLKKGNAWSEILTADVREEASLKILKRDIFKKVSRIDCLVCTAGIHLKKKFLEMKWNEWRNVLDVNLAGTAIANRIFGAEFVKQHGGVIINVSSLGARVALSEASAYCVSKAGVSMLTKSLACEWAESGVRVNALLPGVFPTPLNQKALSDRMRKSKIVAKTPMARLGKCRELAGAAVFLASDEASFVTGEELVVDGGFLASAGF